METSPLRQVIDRPQPLARAAVLLQHLVGEFGRSVRAGEYRAGTLRQRSFVRRVAHTPHYDGVKKGGKEPAVIGIIGVAPIELKLVDPSKPPVREV